jgi:hypothetical protein
MAAWLRAASFAAYPPEGRKLAASNLPALQAIPVALLPVFLVDLKVYDWKFPLEQREIAQRIEFAQAEPLALAGFRAIHVSAALDNPDQVADPQRFLAEMTAYLWSSLQMDAYRTAANEFVSRFAAQAEPARPVAPRLVMVCVGQDAQAPEYPLFHKLSKLGQMQTRVRAGGAAQALVDKLRQRSESHAADYAHWYLDGGASLPGLTAPGVTRILYPELAPLNEQILARMKACIAAGTGPEVLQQKLAELAERPPGGDGSFGDGSFVNGSSTDARLQHFALSLLTEGSGVQIFSTSFVQWTMREVLRRAQPATLLARFAPRQRQKTFDAMVAAAANVTDPDPDGSLIDGDMAAYYAYLEMMRLPDAEDASFLVWFENHMQALIVGRAVPGGTTNDSPTTMPELLARLTERS